MNYLLTLGIGFSVGMLLGYLYFRGLWWTVQRMTEYRNPYVFALLSFFIRSAIVVAGFYMLLLVRWEAVAVGLAGFIAMRMIAVRRWGLNPPELERKPGEEKWS